MFEFLRIQYKLNPNVVNEEYLKRMVTKERITEEEKNLIINQE